MNQIFAYEAKSAVIFYKYYTLRDPWANIFKDLFFILEKKNITLFWDSKVVQYLTSISVIFCHRIDDKRNKYPIIHVILTKGYYEENCVDSLRTYLSEVI